MAQFGFCGLGQMGAVMAGRLIDAGHELTVWNRTAGRADELVARGAREAASPAEAAVGTEGVFTMVTDAEALNAVVFGHDGAAAGLAPEATLIDMSTVGPEAVRDVGARLGGDGRMLDAPVSGSVPQAREGTLKVYVGGADDAYERYVPALGAFGRATHVGPLGSGAAMKLVVNSTLGAAMTALGEALALGDRLGLREPDLLDVLAESPLGRTVGSKRDKIESGAFPANFKLSLAAKDMRLVHAGARRAELEAHVATAVLAAFQAAEAAGLGDLDYSAVVAHIRGKPAGGGDA